MATTWVNVSRQRLNMSRIKARRLVSPIFTLWSLERNFPHCLTER